VFCVLGDGEMQEGQNWEAMMAAASFGLNNLVAAVDRNHLQNDGPTEDIVALGDLVAKAKAFGWEAQAFDGHDFDALEAAFAAVANSLHPSFLVADTVKGKGVSFMEGVVHWHHHPISDAEYTIAMSELSGGTSE
jgi:transketolase